MDHPTQAKSLSDLVADREALDARIKEARDKEIAGVRDHICKLVRDYGITVDDIFPGTSVGQRKPIAPKYRNPATGQTWTGRGKAPIWTRGLKLDEYRIATAA